MLEEKHAAIAKYLNENFPGLEIEQRHDFDRGAHTFKIHMPKGTLLLKVGDEFVADNDITEILRLFNLWSLKETLGKEKELGVLVTQRGLELFERG